MLFAKAQLLQFTNYAIAPFLYHSAEGSTIAMCCESLYEFVDAYATLIIAIMFIISLVLTKNFIFSLYSRFVTGNSQTTADIKTTRTLSSMVTSLNTSFIKLIRYFS